VATAVPNTLAESLLPKVQPKKFLKLSSTYYEIPAEYFFLAAFETSNISSLMMTSLKPIGTVF